MPADKPLAALLLAAGRSQRFNDNKLAYPVSIGGSLKPLLLHTLSNWLAVFDKLYLMLPAADETLHLLIAELPSDQRDAVTIISVGQPELGMSQSLKAGINASQDAAGWLIGLADMPWVKPKVLSALQQSIMAGADIAAPYYQGLRGQPVAFSADYQQALMAISGDQGARQLLQQNKQQIVAVDSPDDGILRDIDTQADLSSPQTGRAQSQLNSR